MSATRVKYTMYGRESIGQGIPPKRLDGNVYRYVGVERGIIMSARNAAVPTTSSCDQFMNVYGQGKADLNCLLNSWY